MGRAGEVKPHAKPLLLWLSVRQDRAGGREIDGLGGETIKIILKTMTIKTKYNIGDEVWFMYENKPMQIPIGHIEVYYGYKLNKNGEEVIEKRVVYIDWYGEHRISESKLFPTKEELLKSL